MLFSSAESDWLLSFIDPVDEHIQHLFSLFSNSIHLLIVKVCLAQIERFSDVKVADSEWLS